MTSLMCGFLKRETGQSFLQEKRRRFLFAVHRTVSAAQPGNGADNGKIGQAGESEHFRSDADGRQPGVGGTPEHCRIAERRTKHSRESEQRRSDSAQAGTDGEQRRDFTALESDGKGADGEQQLAQKVEPVDRFAVAGKGNQICAESGIASLSAEEEKQRQHCTADGDAQQGIGEQFCRPGFSLFQQQGEDTAGNAGENAQQKDRHGKRCSIHIRQSNLKGLQRPSWQKRRRERQGAAHGIPACPLPGLPGQSRLPPAAHGTDR